MRVVPLVVAALLVAACQSGTDPSLVPDSSPACSFAVVAQTDLIGSDGGTATVTVMAPDECAWTATSEAEWLTIDTGGSGSGDGTLTITAAPNPAAESRTGTVTVAGQPVTITQCAVACSFAVAPLTAAVPVAGGSSDVTVTAPAGCDWVATTTTPWLTVTAGANG